VWDGDDLLLEYDGSGFTLRRFMHGPGDDNPLIWFEGPTMDQAHQQLLIADHQGSIVGVTNAAGALTSSLTYDPYGSTPSFAGPRFRYTGQIAIPEIGLYYYKARFYDPMAQRFLQTDPIGMKDDENLYAYVKDDPVDRTDPAGTTCSGSGQNTVCQVDKVEDKQGNTRNATAADHKQYAKFEKAYTAAVRNLLAHPGRVAQIAFKNGDGRTIRFSIGSASLAKGEAARIYVADPSNASQNRDQHGHVSSDGVTPETGPRTTYAGRGMLFGASSTQRTEVGHEGIHYSPEEKAATSPGYGPTDENGDAHQSTYNSASSYLQGGPK
jgi:RHS repeat-associated protein